MMLIAKLNTNNEVPVVRGDALGMVSFILSEDRKEMMIHGVFNNLSGPIIGCHIHQAREGLNGPVLIDLSAFIFDFRIKGRVAVTKAILDLAQQGELYINVHTTAHPNGEIRGQLVFKTETIIPFLASADQVVPPDTTEAYAFGTLRISQNLTRIEYQFQSIGLTGPVTAAHIHSGAAGMTGQVIATFNTGDFSSGVITDTAVIRKVYTEILNGNAYVNIHTVLHPDGEIRAQLESYLMNAATALLTGDSEVPPVTTVAKAVGYAVINPSFDSIYYAVMHAGLSPTAAHIHEGPIGSDGPVLFELEELFPGFYAGRHLIGEVNLNSFFKDELYFNIHTTANPGGEIRGQIESSWMNSFAFDLCGDQEVPKKNIPGYAAGYIAINRSNSEMDYGLISNGLNGDATTTRLYEGLFGANGTNLLSLDLPNTYTSRVVPIASSIVTKMNADKIYINVHTAANPSGEIRGQVRRVLSCAINTSSQNTDLIHSELLNNLAANELILKVEDSFNASVFYIQDISGKNIQTIRPENIFHTSNEWHIKTGALHGGIYLLHVTSKSGASIFQKFIK
jgi:hypothetical protein